MAIKKERVVRVERLGPIELVEKIVVEKNDLGYYNICPWYEVQGRPSGTSCIVFGPEEIGTLLDALSEAVQRSRSVETGVLSIKDREVRSILAQDGVILSIEICKLRNLVVLCKRYLNKKTRNEILFPSCINMDVEGLEALQGLLKEMI